MCEPTTALFAAQAVIGATGAIKSGMSQASAHSANAAALEVQAANRRAKAAFDVEQEDRKYRRVSGERDARIGSTGIDSSSFSDIRADDAAESALEKAATMWSAENEAKSLEFQASGQRRAAKDAKTASFFNAASAVVGAASGYVKGQTLGVKTNSSFAPAGSTSYGGTTGYGYEG